MTDPAQLHAQAISAFNRRDWPQALDVAARLIPLAPQQAGLYYIAGIASLELQRLPQAMDYLRRATELDPGRADFAAQFAKVLSISRQSREALAAADRSLALSPEDPPTLDTLGVVYTQAHAHERAAEVFRRAVRLMPTLAHYRFNLATSLIFAGDIDAAQDELEACLALDPRYWKAHLTLAQLRRQTPEHHHLERLRSLLPATRDDDDARMYVNLALAKEYEDLGDYPKAFDHLEQGKSAGGAGRRYTIRRDEALFEALKRAFPEPVTAATGDPTDEPIFVIGMPRSGTTLVERIISSHPQVHSAGELQNFGVSLKRISGSRTPFLLDPDTVGRARNADWRRLGEHYVASTRPATGHTPRFLDKLPHNFLYAGFIANALPNARIICLRRDPLDTCLSNFRQLFAQTSPYYDYSFDLLDTGKYYVLFDRLMAHWHRVFPGRILEVDYEALVDAQESSTQRLLQHCGLPWHDACLQFEQNPAPVATASAVQVRSPIYRNAVRRWKNYETQLQPLQDLLHEAGIPIGR